MNIKPKTHVLSEGQRSALRRAVAEAQVWRGSMVGNPDTGPLDEFDRFIFKAKSALITLGIRPSK
jgi:hypothetical protein